MTTHTDLAAQADYFDNVAKDLERGISCWVSVTAARAAANAARKLAALESQPDAAQGAPETNAAHRRLIELASECAQRKPLAALSEFEDATHIGHRQFARAYAKADEAVRSLAMDIRSAADALLAATPKPQEQAAQVVAVPGGEPVARVVPHEATVRLEWASVEAAHNAKPGPLYATPQPAAKPAQRPQNCGTGFCSCIECPYETAQAERVALKPLTEQEIRNMYAATREDPRSKEFTPEHWFVTGAAIQEFHLMRQAGEVNGLTAPTGGEVSK